MKYPKHIRFLPFLLAAHMLVSSAPAQTTAKTTVESAEDRPTETEVNSPGGDAISAARRPYTQSATADGTSRDGDDGMSLAQFSPSRPMRSSPPHHGYPGASYHRPWSDHSDAKHALIGAAIGFGLGAAIGAKANTSPYPGTTVRAVFLVGGVGALIGAAVGGAHGGPSRFTHHKTIRPPLRREDEESDLSADSIGPHFERRSTP
jgi:hypothetical protein